MNGGFIISYSTYIFKMIGKLLQGIFLAAMCSGVYFVASWVVYYFFFEPWAGDMIELIFGISLYIVYSLSLIFCIVVPMRAEWKNQKEEMRREKEQKARLAAYNSRPENLIENFIDKYPKETQRLLEGIAKDASGLYPFTENNTLSLSQHQSQESMQVTNDERLILLEKELAAIHNLNPDDLISDFSNIQRQFEKDSIEGIPLSPLKEVLAAGTIIDEKYIKTLYNRIKSYESRYLQALNYLEKEMAIIRTGIKGENNVFKELAMYKGVWEVFPNVRFEVEGQSVESDFLLVSSKGIYTLEVKNYSPTGKYSIHITSDGQWLKILSNGRTEPMDNVTNQMNRHIAYKHQLINSEMKKMDVYSDANFYIEPIFVIANDVIQVKNDSDLPIMRASQIYHYVKKQPEILNQKQIEEISKIIKGNNLPPKKYELSIFTSSLLNDYEALSIEKENINILLNIIREYSESSKDAILKRSA